jgi:hypothetical protein
MTLSRQIKIKTIKIEAINRFSIPLIRLFLKPVIRLKNRSARIKISNQLKFISH